MITEKVIAAVKTKSEFELATKSDCDIVFWLSPNILTVSDALRCCHNVGKKLFIHIDLMDGIGKDKSGIHLLKKMNVDGIISTRANLIKLANEEGLFTVQRFFLVDSKSLVTTVETVKQSKCDVIEIMPGIIPKVISFLKKELDIPIIAGGLIDTYDEILAAKQNGALTVSVGKSEFWGK